MKASPAITAWLQQEIRRTLGSLLFDAFVHLVVGVLVLLVTFGLLYFALLLGFDWLIADAETRFWVGGVLIVVLFILYRLTNHARLERELLLAGDARTRLLHILGLAPSPATGATPWANL